MRVFFRCVAEAVAENGFKGLAEMVPGGPYAYALAESFLRRYREACALEAIQAVRAEQREVRELAEANLEDARAEMVVIAREMFAPMPTGYAEHAPTADELVDLELFVAGIPDAVRQSLKRIDDPTGRSMPNGFALRTADDVLRLFPARPPRFRPGDALPGKSDWVLDRLLGMGGFGEVWFTHHTEFDSLSGAVKFCFGQSGRELIHEGGLINRVMKAGRHPNIVPLLEAHLKGDRPWLLFEYVAGGNLSDWIHRLAGRPPADRLTQVLAALRQLCEAVACFHQLSVPIVHRDLKPSNILLDKATKKLRITDFGIGSVTGSETNRMESRGQGTRGGRLLSFLRGSYTPLYSSPQQRMGAEPDPRDDVHALGVIAFQMLTGKLDAAPGPRAGKALKEVGVDDALVELLLNCASEEVADRPRNAMELLEQLPTGRVPTKVASIPTPAPPPPQVVRDSFSPRERSAAGETATLTLSDGTNFTFAWVPPGSFQLGGNEANRSSQHRLDIGSGFWMGITPVTQEQWESVMGNNPSHFQGQDRPVESVTWKECQAFCQRLSELTGRPFRLPTETEWEYACRAGSMSDYSNGDDEESLRRVGWYSGNSGGQTHPVGKLLPNAWGLFDVHGNVWEWCQDAYPDPSSSKERKLNRSNLSYHVLRGGSYMGGTRNCTSSVRSTFHPEPRDNRYGLRVCFNPGD